MLEYFFVGFLGGLARALYGLLKAVERDVAVNAGYFLVTLFVSAAIGGMLGIFFDIDLKVAGLSGYVGTDILENVFTGMLPKSITLNKKNKK